MSAQHTPTPWHVVTGDRCYHVVSNGRTFSTGCISFDGNGKANATLIVTAVNHHAELVKLARSVKSLCENWGSGKQLTKTAAYLSACELLAKIEDAQ